LPELDQKWSSANGLLKQDVTDRWLAVPLYLDQHLRAPITSFSRHHPLHVPAMSLLGYPGS
jgi:hypothetical protein